MSQPSQPSVRNFLLRGLSAEDLGLVQPHLEPVGLKRSEVIVAANQPIEHVYFLSDGIAPVVATAGDKRLIEVGLYGREGMGGTAVLLGTDRTPHENFIQVEGSGWRMRADHLRRAVQHSPSLQELFLR